MFSCCLAGLSCMTVLEHAAGLTDFLVCVQGGLPRLLEVHDGRWAKRWCPLAHVGAVGIELAGLQLRVKDAEEWRGVIAAASDPLPIEGIGGRIGVDKRVPEPLFAVALVDAEVLRQKGAHHHAHAVMHVTGMPELAHSGVDKRDAGLARVPGF